MWAYYRSFCLVNLLVSVRNVICEIEWGLVKMFCVFGTELDGCLKGKYANFQLWINVIHFKILSKFGKLWHVLEVAHDSCRLAWSRPVFRHSSYPVYAAVMILRWKFRTAEITCKQVRYFRIMTVASIRFWRAPCWFFFSFCFWLNTDIVHGSHLRFAFPILSLAPGISVAKWRLFLSCAPVPTLHPGVAAGRGALWLAANFLAKGHKLG